MGKHANERAWREYDTWRTREPEEAEVATNDAEDYAREAAEVQGEFGQRFRPARHVRLFDEY